MKSDTAVHDYLGLSTANVSDALDRLGLRGAPQSIFPLWPGCPKIVGKATTMKLVPKGSQSPVTGTLEAIMAAERGNILVIDHGGRLDVNSWGGMATFTAARRHLAGIVIDGVTRDIDEIRKLRFPVYGKGVIQQSVRGRCAFGGLNAKVHLGGVLVRRGDLVMGDSNGIVVVPQNKIFEVLQLAKRSGQTDKRIMGWIARGMNPVRAHLRAKYDRPRLD